MKYIMHLYAIILYGLYYVESFIIQYYVHCKLYIKLCQSKLINDRGSLCERNVQCFRRL